MAISRNMVLLVLISLSRQSILAWQIIFFLCQVSRLSLHYAKQLTLFDVLPKTTGILANIYMLLKDKGANDSLEVFIDMQMSTSSPLPIGGSAKRSFAGKKVFNEVILCDWFNNNLLKLIPHNIEFLKVVKEVNISINLDDSLIKWSC